MLQDNHESLSLPLSFKIQGSEFVARNNVEARNYFEILAMLESVPRRTTLVAFPQVVLR